MSHIQSIENHIYGLFSNEEDDVANIDNLFNTCDISPEEEEIINNDDVEIAAESYGRIEGELNTMTLAIRTAEEFIFSQEGFDIGGIWKKFWNWLLGIFKKVKEYVIAGLMRITLWFGGDFKKMAKWAIDNKDKLVESDINSGLFTAKRKSRAFINFKVIREIAEDINKECVSFIEKNPMDELLGKLQNFVPKYLAMCDEDSRINKNDISESEYRKMKEESKEKLLDLLYQYYNKEDIDKLKSEAMKVAEKSKTISKSLEDSGKVKEETLKYYGFKSGFEIFAVLSSSKLQQEIFKDTQKVVKSISNMISSIDKVVRNTKIDKALTTLSTGIEGGAAVAGNAVINKFFNDVRSASAMIQATNSKTSIMFLAIRLAHMFVIRNIYALAKAGLGKSSDVAKDVDK